MQLSICAFVHITYVKGMTETGIDPFASTESELELDAETSRILEERIESADVGRLPPAEEARQRMEEWLSKSGTTKTR
ncbi:MAG: hypothetical protein JO097_05050 [Acidobacteriaceae bacterium]|nr:hypothetical protein [Acidobacteriaceae bacterium]MBV9765743.1 hypothetical protein [Acidobacteriaceae bacterium]